MEVSGPTKVLMKDGYPVNLYEVVIRRRTPKGTTATFYLFKREAEAEIYYQYLLQVIGVEDLDKTIANKRTFEWERQELVQFRNTLDLTELEDAVKGLHFEQNTVFYPAIGKHKRVLTPKPPIDTEERIKWHKRFQNYQI